jgi:hypothetical protein
VVHRQSARGVHALSACRGALLNAVLWRPCRGHASLWVVDRAVGPRRCAPCWLPICIKTSYCCGKTCSQVNNLHLPDPRQADLARETASKRAAPAWPCCDRRRLAAKSSWGGCWRSSTTASSRWASRTWRASQWRRRCWRSSRGPRCAASHDPPARRSWLTTGLLRIASVAEDRFWWL